MICSRFRALGIAGLVGASASLAFPLSAASAQTVQNADHNSGGAVAQRAAPTTVDSKGGYLACKGGKKIRVRVDYNAIQGDQKVLARIYRTPSRSSKGDVNRYMPSGRGEYNNTVFVDSGISVGYWNVTSTPVAKIVNQFTHARCVK